VRYFDVVAAVAGAEAGTFVAAAEAGADGGIAAAGVAVVVTAAAVALVGLHVHGHVLHHGNLNFLDDGHWNLDLLDDRVGLGHRVVLHVVDAVGYGDGYRLRDEDTVGVSVLALSFAPSISPPLHKISGRG